MKATISIVWTITASVLLLLGIATVVVSGLAIHTAGPVRYTQQYLYKEGSRDNIYEDLFNGNWTGWLIYVIAFGASLGSIRSILAAGIVAIAMALASVFILVAGSQKRNQPAWPQYAGFSISVALITTIASMIGLIYSMAKTYSSSAVYHGPYPQLGPDDLYLRDIGGPGNGSYSLEAWTCQARDLFAVSLDRGIVDEICRLSVCFSFSHSRGDGESG